MSYFVVTFFFFFFFFFSSRRRHTRFDCDWSSDVCSSDLRQTDGVERARRQRRQQHEDAGEHPEESVLLIEPLASYQLDDRQQHEIGRASCRERVEISVGAVSVEKKNIDVGTRR